MATTSLTMIRRFILQSALLLTATVAASTKDDSHYVGSVVEYHRVWDDSKSSEENIDINLNSYLDFIKAGASKKADIIVFPEMGLQTLNTTVFIPVPDPKDQITPRKDPEQHEVLRQLSNAAYNNKIYVVVNILEEASTGDIKLRHNTNVAFDREGTIIARYRKFHLYSEHGLQTTEHPEYSYFDTDFGVRFGLFTCFDILFSQPALQLINEYQVTDIAFPTAWMSQLPFLTAIQAQASWSHGTGANLLAAGLNDVRMGHSGSGIYGGTYGPIVHTMKETDGSELLYNYINKKGKLPQNKIEKSLNLLTRGDNIPPTDPEEDWTKRLKILTDDLKLYKTFLLDPPYDNEITSRIDKEKRTKISSYQFGTTLCQKKLCCEFTLNFTMEFRAKEESSVRDTVKGDEMDFFRYRLAVLDGMRSFGGDTTAGVQVCGLIPCLNTELSTCGVRADSLAAKPLSTLDGDLGAAELYRTSFTGIRINGSFDGSDSFVGPSVLETSDSPGLFGRVPGRNEMTFVTRSTAEDSLYTVLELRAPEKDSIRLVTAALHSRVFHRDGQPLPNAPDSTNLTAFYMLALFIITAIFVGWPYCIPSFCP